MDKHHVRSWVPLWVSCVLVIILNQAFAAPLADYAIETNIIGKGQITKQPDKSSYALGELVGLTAVPDPGSRFVGWSGDISPQIWWDDQYGYRLPITVAANGYVRLDKPVEIALNFTDLLGELESNTPFDRDSLRLIEIDGTGKVKDSSIPFQFDQNSDYNAATNAAGELTFLMTGTTVANADRRYMLYFDVEGSGHVPVSITPRLDIYPNDTDEGQSSIRIVTRNANATPKATYYFHKEGGGFSSVNDASGNDWVNFNSAPGSAGDYRGIPNMVPPASGGYFHPGRNTSSTSVLAQGPLKARFRSTADNGQWQVLWTVYPAYATMVVEKAAGTYWFLYEGTPGGKLDVTKDFVVRSDKAGVSTLAAVQWEEELAGEDWVYFGDPDLNRSLFMAHLENDATATSYRPQHTNPINELGAMTVFGFGRLLTPLSGSLSGSQRHLTFGLLDGTDFSANQNAIRSAVKPLLTTLGFAEKQQTSTTNPYLFRVNGNSKVTATFAAIEYDLTVNVMGEGEVKKSPDKTAYSYGEEVTLEALPGPGWSFASWSDGLGKNPEIVVTIDGDRVVTATFTQDVYTLDLKIFGKGAVQISPTQETYHFGDEVDLTAEPEQDWKFFGWGGDLNGMNSHKRLVIEGDQFVTATFVMKEIRNYLPMVSAD